MMVGDKKAREKKYFNLSENDRHLHHIEEAEKKDKKNAANKVFDCFEKKKTDRKENR